MTDAIATDPQFTAAHWDEMRDALRHLTVRDLRALARREGIYLGGASAKYAIVGEIVNQRRYRAWLELTGEGA